MAEIVPVTTAVVVVSGGTTTYLSGEALNRGDFVSPSASHPYTLRCSRNPLSPENSAVCVADAAYFTYGPILSASHSGSIIDLGVTLQKGMLYIRSATRGRICPFSDVTVNGYVHGVGWGTATGNLLLWSSGAMSSYESGATPLTPTQATPTVSPIQSAVAAETIGIGQPIYRDLNNVARLLSAAITAPNVGIYGLAASSVVSGQTVGFIQHGRVALGVTPKGGNLYVAGQADGEIVPYTDLVTDDWIYPLGFEHASYANSGELLLVNRRLSLQKG